MEKRPLILAVDDEGSILELLHVNLAVEVPEVAYKTVSCSR